MEWRKSAYSCCSANCVEVALDAVVHVRDTKARQGGTLRFERDSWRAFLEWVKQP